MVRRAILLLVYVSVMVSLSLFFVLRANALLDRTAAAIMKNESSTVVAPEKAQVQFPVTELALYKNKH